MRLWSLHPRYLDRQGLVAVWREGLLAQAVLLGRTRGYRSHPQLERFRSCDEPAAAIGHYLTGIAGEAENRGYRFDASKISAGDSPVQLTVTDGQVEFERQHLHAKILRRSPHETLRLDSLEGWPIDTHPMFTAAAGDIEGWERGAPPSDHPA